ncbi:MAG: glycerophosphodiester phosphodiesterase [Geodermatophilaceae bacterium]|nr:glycerophosphodiester phosphodiesterase [Geodermatophilaceae bacterium]
MRRHQFSYRRAVAATVAAALAVGLMIGLAAAAGPASAAPDGGITSEPLVIAHRGASGYRPEHTLAAYELAIRMGTDYIEPDLVSTKDGVLVARHENEISTTTDVADRPVFANRRTTKIVDGVSFTGWFTEDFTLAELKQLRAKERLPDIRPNNTIYDGRFRIPTLQEIIDLAVRYRVGIYPETKHPTYFDSIGLSLEEPLVATLRANGLNRPDSEVFIQSFETTNLRQLNRVIDVPLVQLIGGTGAPYDLVAAGSALTYDDLATPAGLRRIAGYADGIGPDKNRIVPRDAAGFLLEPTALVDNAHRAGLLVHPYTFRAENTFLPADFRIGTDPARYGDIAAEYELFFSLGVDGVFADQPDIAVYARRLIDDAAA